MQLNYVVALHRAPHCPERGHRVAVVVVLEQVGVDAQRRRHLRVPHEPAQFATEGYRRRLDGAGSPARPGRLTRPAAAAARPRDRAVGGRLPAARGYGARRVLARAGRPEPATERTPMTADEQWTPFTAPGFEDDDPAESWDEPDDEDHR